MFVRGAAVLTAALLLGALLQQVNREVNGAYMDEVFHVGQAQRLCRGEWHWDPAITTPPGMYAVAMGLTLLGIECSLGMLRTTCAVCSLGLFLTLLRMNPKNLWKAIEMYTFPPLFFFSFLYYTDVPSALSVLLCYHLIQSRHFAASALCGLWAVSLRQTNIVWVFYCAGLYFFAQMRSKRHQSLSSTLSIVYQLRYHALVGCAFVLFLIWNEGIVLGDKAHHKPVLHIPQLLYFTVLCAATSPISLRKMDHFIQFCARYASMLIPVLPLLDITIKHFTYAHPFLLSDNRHYTFYLWKDLLRHRWVQRSLIPIYLFSAHVIYQNLSRRSWLNNALFLLCTSLVLIPAPLVEVRYFILPWLLYQLHAPSRARQYHQRRAVLFMAANLVLLGVFLFRPFSWVDGSTARFMW